MGVAQAEGLPAQQTPPCCASLAPHTEPGEALPAFPNSQGPLVGLPQVEGEPAVLSGIS